MPQSPDNLRDDELVRAFKGGDTAAMEALYRKYRGQVFGWLAATVRDRAEAEDLCQEIWLRVIRGIDRYSGGNFCAWMWRIARNAVIDHSRKRTEEPVLDIPAGDGDGEESVADQIPDDAGLSAIERLEAKESREIVRRAIGALSPRLREVALLRVASDLKFQEIADLTGLPLGTVLGRMNLAMKKLREALLREGVDNG